MSKSFVDANYRFIAAYNEVNARIAHRQQALALYVTLVVSLLAALVAGGNAIGLGAVWKIYPERIGENQAVVWLTASVTLVSLIALLMIPRWSYRPGDATTDHHEH